MRNALLKLSSLGLLLVPVLADANPLEITPLAPSTVVHALPMSTYAPDVDQQLLPVRGSDLPLSTATASSSTSSTGPNASTVEAIPTPTAFHAGGLLLIVMFVARYCRKVRMS